MQSSPVVARADGGIATDHMLDIAHDLAIVALTNFAAILAAARMGEIRLSDALRHAREIEQTARRIVEAIADDVSADARRSKK